jgi:hypothetical protein
MLDESDKVFLLKKVKKTIRKNRVTLKEVIQAYRDAADFLESVLLEK